MQADINNSNNNLNPDMYVPSQSQSTKIEKSAIVRTFKNIMAPVFDSFRKETQTGQNVMRDYSNDIESQKIKNAETLKILNDADPKSRSKLNIVI